MRRAVRREVTVFLAQDEVRASILTMSRCPKVFRESATITEVEEGVDVKWVEGPNGVDNSQPDANPVKSKARRRRDLVDLVGKTIGKWEVLQLADRRAYPGGGQQTMFVCRCECGTEKEVSGGTLRSGSSRSCKNCASTRVPDEDRKCKYCGVGLRPKSRLPTRCPRCNRQVERTRERIEGGLCPCGKFPYYPTKDCPKCDRKAGQCKKPKSRSAART